MRSSAMSNLLLYLGGVVFLACSFMGTALAQTCVPPPVGLVSWWPGDGNARDIIGPNDGTPQDGITFAPGMVGQAFSFDGVEGYVRVPDHPSLNPASALTIEAWINSTLTEGPRVIVAKWNDNTSDWSYIFKDHNDSDKLRIELSESIHNDLADIEGSTSIPLGTWVHVATTYDASEGLVRLYFNGVEDISQTVGLGRLIDSSLTDLIIGALFTGGSVLEHFAGRVDEVSIYNRALSAEEIAAIFAAGSAGKCKEADGPTLWEGNGHYYLIVNQETTWQQARLLAESMEFMGVQGHLATITSEDENRFVTTQLGDTAGAWLGGEQPPSSLEPAGGWRWITGEPWVYTNWDAGEPSNTYLGGWGKDATGQPEERLQHHHDGTHWNDLPDDPEIVTPRFIVEWDVASHRSCQGGRAHIRGRITTAEDATGLKGVTVTLTGPDACQEAATTKKLGFYLFPHLKDGTYTVTPSKDDCTFNPPSRIVTLEEGGRARLNFAADCP